MEFLQRCELTLLKVRNRRSLSDGSNYQVCTCPQRRYEWG